MGLLPRQDDDLAQMRTTELPQPQKCPACGYQFTDATALNTNERPSPGDWTICIGCTAILRFYGHTLEMRRASPADVAELHPENVAEIAAIRRAIRRIKASRN